MEPTVNDIRKTIDEIDASIIRLLAKRFRLARALALQKNRVRESAREREVLSRVSERAQAAGLRRIWAEKVWKIIIAESRKHQYDIRARSRNT